WPSPVRLETAADSSLYPRRHIDSKSLGIEMSLPRTSHTILFLIKRRYGVHLSASPIAASKTLHVSLHRGILQLDVPEIPRRCFGFNGCCGSVVRRGVIGVVVRQFGLSRSLGRVGIYDVEQKA